jgi:UDP-GlcNAc:undecaprenyl-phosphate GlcNAc-1-phosphate transferase
MPPRRVPGTGRRSRADPDTGVLIVDRKTTRPAKASAIRAKRKGMMPGYSFALAAFGSLAITVAAMSVLRPLAYIVDLLDRPGGHKTHSGAVPVVGGMAMLVGIVFGLSLAPGSLASANHFIVSATLLVVIGMFDDRFTLSPKMRLVGQFVAVLPMVFGAGVFMHDFGDLFGTGAVELTRGTLFATAFVTMAAINAFNMLDGLDGLAGGLALIALLAFMFLGVPAIGSAQFLMLATVAGSVIGFLVFNVPIQANRRIRCFMGDAGSTLLGFSIAWLALDVSQRPGAVVSPVTLVWMVAVPATDLLWTMTRRLWRGQSPLRADNEHLHHVLLKSGLGVRAVFCTMFATTLVGASVGIAFHYLHVPDWISLLCLIAMAISVVVTYRNARTLLPYVPIALRREPESSNTREQGVAAD